MWSPDAVQIGQGIHPPHNCSACQFLYENREMFKGSYFLKIVAEKFPAVKDVVSVSEDENVLSAFRKIKEEGVSGVAVVNKEGVLIGNISATDIRVSVETDRGSNNAGCACVRPWTDDLPYVTVCC